LQLYMALNPLLTQHCELQNKLPSRQSDYERNWPILQSAMQSFQWKINSAGITFCALNTKMKAVCFWLGRCCHCIHRIPRCPMCNSTLICKIKGRLCTQRPITLRLQGRQGSGVDSPHKNT
jgi:hypothetical protein